MYRTTLSPADLLSALRLSETSNTNSNTFPPWPVCPSLFACLACSATLASCSFLRAEMITFAPARAKRIAVAAPMPPEAPVMRAVLLKSREVGKIPAMLFDAVLRKWIVRSGARSLIVAIV